jgi:hypothetical protein
MGHVRRQAKLRIRKSNIRAAPRPADGVFGAIVAF